MKRITFFRTWLLAITILLVSVSVSAQLLVEDFNYTVGTVLTATATADPTTGWLAHSGNGTTNIAVTSGLSFAGYAGTGIGGAANVCNTGQDINKTFTSQTAGTVYAAFMLQTSSPNSSGYFFMLSPSPVSSTFYSRVWVNANGDGIGISGSSAPAAYITITPGTPVLVVVKHDFTNHVSSLYVLNAFSATEPGTPSQTFAETASAIGGIALRQYNAAQRLIVDGLRIGTVWSDACAAPGNPKAATPTFSATPGNVITTQSVTLSCATSGATIYYTTDGTTPSNSPLNGTLYDGVTPISVSSTTTIKAIAYATGVDPSTVATGIYNFPTEVNTISALRTSSASGFYKFTGQALLTFQNNIVGKVKFIQDATAGIVIYDGPNKITTPYSIGDKISNLYCTLQMYNGMLELIPFADPGAAVSTGNTVTPTVVTLANILNYPGQLVTVKNVAITGTGNFVASTSSTTYLVINDGAAGFLRVAYSDLPYVGIAIPTAKQDITGVVNLYSTTEADLIPRTAADIVPTTITGLNQTLSNTGIYSSNGNVVLTAVEGETVSIFTAAGQKLLSKVTVQGLNTIPVNAHGIVIVKVGNRIEKVIL